MGNYRFFYLFLLWTATVDVFFIFISYPSFQYALDFPMIPEANRLIDRRERGMVIIGFALAVAVFVGLLAFLGFHTYLILTNQTTMEWATRDSRRYEALRRSATLRRNPYDMGRRLNWEQIFGESRLWIFSWLRSKGTTDGTVLAEVPVTDSGGQSHNE
jgi:palmitoyltransferase